MHGSRVPETMWGNVVCIGTDGQGEMLSVATDQLVNAEASQGLAAIRNKHGLIRAL